MKTEGLFDPKVLRTIQLTFTQANWQNQLKANYSSGANLLGNIECAGITNLGIGVRYRGNTSYQMSGAKKSLNFEIDYTNSEARWMGYKTVNLINAYMDESIMREPLYFNVMRQYAMCPRASMAKLYINGVYWGVYSFVQQEDDDLMKEWCASNDGDRWRAPNMPGQTGGGGRPGGGRQRRLGSQLPGNEPGHLQVQLRTQVPALHERLGSPPERNLRPQQHASQRASGSGRGRAGGRSLALVSSDREHLHRRGRLLLQRRRLHLLSRARERPHPPRGTRRQRVRRLQPNHRLARPGGDR